MGIEEKYKGLLDNEEGHFAHHQMLQADIINHDKILEKNQEIMERILQNNRDYLLIIKKLADENEEIKRKIDSLSIQVQAKKRRHMKIYNLEAEFMYSWTSKEAVLTQNIYPILWALLQDQWATLNIDSICLAFIHDDNIEQKFMPILNKTLQVNLIKKQSGSVKISFIYIDKEICMRELKTDASRESFLHTFNEPMNTQYQATS